MKMHTWQFRLVGFFQPKILILFLIPNSQLRLITWRDFVEPTWADYVKRFLWATRGSPNYWCSKHCWRLDELSKCLCNPTNILDLHCLQCITLKPKRISQTWVFFISWFYLDWIWGTTWGSKIRFLNRCKQWLLIVSTNIISVAILGIPCVEISFLISNS